MEKLYSLSFKQIRTYLFAAVFIAGNLLLPFAVHHLPPMYTGAPNNGVIWLPIYFFTLIAAYKYGIQVGLLTAVLSPTINCLLFGMPMLASLPIIMVKSVLLALAAAFFAHKAGKISLLAILSTVLAYQLAGSSIEWIGSGFTNAFNEFRFGFPGMLLQVFGGYLVLKALAKI